MAQAPVKLPLLEVHEVSKPSVTMVSWSPEMIGPIGVQNWFEELQRLVPTK